MKIVVRAKQVLDGEVNFDQRIEFKSVNEFKKASMESLENWENMQGNYAMIFRKSPEIHVGIYLDLQCKGNSDREVWQIVDIFLD